MKSRLILACGVVAFAAVTSGCATIVSKGSQTITVTSVPDAANVSIVNLGGDAVHSGMTPMTVTLKKGRGYFKPETYTVRFSKEGFQPREITVRGQVNGWYFGNIIFGGLIGLLAVDPATGAMYTLTPKAVGATLASANVTQVEGQQTLTVVMLADVPLEYRDQLIAVQTD
jgi:hypothetical protein